MSCADQKMKREFLVFPAHSLVTIKDIQEKSLKV
jgi:hypothetical protein